MGTKFWEVVGDEDGIGGSGECYGDNDAHFERINVFLPHSSGGKYVPRAVLFGLEPGVIGAVLLSRGWANSSARKTREPYARAKTGPKATTQGLGTDSSETLCCARLL
jgi:hypothetical protein